MLLGRRLMQMRAEAPCIKCGGTYKVLRHSGRESISVEGIHKVQGGCMGTGSTGLREDLAHNCLGLPAHRTHMYRRPGTGSTTCNVPPHLIQRPLEVSQPQGPCRVGHDGKQHAIRFRSAVDRDSSQRRAAHRVFIWKRHRGAVGGMSHAACRSKPSSLYDNPLKPSSTMAMSTRVVRYTH